MVRIEPLQEHSSPLTSTLITVLPFSLPLSASLALLFVSSDTKLRESLKMLSFVFESPLLNFPVTQIFVIF